MFEHLTSDARRAIVLSNEEALLLGHHYIGTEHLLLGIIHQADVQAFFSSEASLRAVRSQVEEIIGINKSSSPRSNHAPFTTKAKNVLTSSLEVAQSHGQRYVTCEHLLLALLQLIDKDDEAVAGRVLRGLSVDLKALSEKLIATIAVMPQTYAPPSDEEGENDKESAIQDFLEWHQREGSQQFNEDHPISGLYRQLQHDHPAR